MQNSSDAIPVLIILLIYGVFILVAFAIQLLVCFLLYRSCSAIPENYRLTSPGAAFLMLIPLFGLVWVFIYTKNLSNSFMNFFASHGEAKDDCGEKLGLWWGICAICSVVPCLNLFTGIAAFVLMVMYLIKVNECRTQVVGIASPPGTVATTAPYKVPGSPTNPYGY